MAEKQGDFWKLNFDSKVDHLVNKEYDQYLGHPVKGMQAQFRLMTKEGEQRLTPTDDEILSHQFYVAVQRIVEMHANQA